MKNQFIATLLCLSLIGTIAIAQTKKPTTTRKPSTTVQSSAPKTTTKTSTTTTITSPNSTTAPMIVEEKKTTTTTTVSPPSEMNSTNLNSTNSSNSTTIQQSSGPARGSKNPADSKPDKMAEPKTESATKVREPRPERMKNPSSSSDGTGFRIGVKGGVNNLFFLSGGKIDGGTPDFAIGFQGGLVANFGISKTFAIQAEALYVQQNVKFSEGADNIKYSSSGIEIPLALQLNFGGDTKFFINAGGYANYELSSTGSGVVSGVTLPKTDANYTGVSFGDRTDYGAIFGLGVKFNQALFIEARANYSVKDGIYKDAAGKKVAPVFAGLSLGYFF